MSGDSGAGSPAVVGFWEMLAFGCEMAMLAALAVAGWLLAPSPGAAVGLAFVLPAGTGLAWGIWLAPRARRRPNGPALTAAKILVFVVTGAALAVAGHPGWGAALAATAAADALVLQHRETPAVPKAGPYDRSTDLRSPGDQPPPGDQPSPGDQSGAASGRSGPGTVAAHRRPGGNAAASGGAARVNWDG